MSPGLVEYCMYTSSKELWRIHPDWMSLGMSTKAMVVNGVIDDLQAAYEQLNVWFSQNKNFATFVSTQGIHDLILGPSNGTQRVPWPILQ